MRNKGQPSVLHVHGV